MVGKRRVPLFVPWTMAGLVLLVVLTMVVDGAVYASKIHAGVTVAGQHVSGLGREEATAAINQAVDAAQGRSVALVSDKKTWNLTPDSIGLKIDADRAVSAALGTTRDGNFVVDLAQKLKLYFGHRDVPLTATVDQAKLDAVIAQVAQAIDLPAVNAGVMLQGITVKAIKAQDGLTVDQKTLREQLVQAMCRLESGELRVPVAVDKPKVADENSATALAQTKTMLSGPLTMTSEGQKWVFTAVQVAKWVDFKTETVDGVSAQVPYLSADKMAAMFTQVSKEMPTTPVDAHFEGDDTKAWVVPAVPGRVLKPEETAEALTAAALKTTGRTAEAVATLTPPEFTTEEAEAMGIKDLLAVRTTEFTGTTNRQNNVRVATAAINKEGKNFLAPGEEFSFAKTVGPRSPEQGYKVAFGIRPNGELDAELGGGICQVATTLFNSVFFAGLKVTERRNHTIYISHYPEGRDAAVTTDEVDLRFVNDTTNSVWIKGESDGIRTTFWVYGTSDGRKVTFRNSGIYNLGPDPPVEVTTDPKLPAGKVLLVSAGQAYRRVKITRWVTWPDGTVKEDVFPSFYPQRPKIVHLGPGATYP